MAGYHLYYLRNSQVIGSASIDAADDEDAVRVARECGEGQAVEIWNDHGRVRVVAPASAGAAA
jgi:hypothetical protein